MPTPDLKDPFQLALSLGWVVAVSAILDTLSGIYGAVVGGTFEWKFLDQFLRAHVLTRIFPIALTMFAALSLSGTTGQGLWVAVMAEVGAYEAATLKSLLSNLASSKDSGGNVPDQV